MTAHKLTTALFLVCVACTQALDTCEDLNLVVDDDGVCARSRPCHAEVPLSDAQAVCEGWGMRLCSAPELLSGVAAGTGCTGMSDTWTSTPCSLSKNTASSHKTASTNTIKQSPNQFTMYNVNSGDSAVVVSFVDALEISMDGAVLVTLNAGEIHTIESGAAGASLTASSSQHTGALFSAYGFVSVRQREWVPASYAGTSFLVPVFRSDPQTVTVRSTSSSSADVTIELGDGTPVASATLAPGATHTFEINAAETNIAITSTGEILATIVSNQAQSVDFLPLSPAANSLLGVPSGSGRVAGMDGTVVNLVCSDGYTQSATISGTSYHTVRGSSQYSGHACLVTSDSPIFVASYGDSDGVAGTPWADPSRLSRNFIVPFEAEFVAFAASERGYVTIEDAAGSYVTTLQLEGQDGVFFGRYIPSSPIPAGTRMFASCPVVGVVEATASDKESRLFGTDADLPNPPTTSPSFSPSTSRSASPTKSPSISPTSSPSISATPSPSAVSDIFRLFNVNSGNEDAVVVSMLDDMQVELNGVVVCNLNKGETCTLDSDTLATGDVLSAKGPPRTLGAYSRAQRNPREWVPANYAGTHFSLPLMRSPPFTITVLAASADVNMDLTWSNGDAIESAQLSAGEAHTFVVDTEGSVLLDADEAVLVSVVSDSNVDFFAAPAAGMDVTGTPSTTARIAGADGTTVHVECTNGNSFDQTLSGPYMLRSSRQYQGDACRVTADAPIGISSNGDGDGGDGTAWATPNQFATRFVVPFPLEFMDFVSHKPGVVTATLGDERLASVVLAADAEGGNVFKGYMKPSGGFPAGTWVESSVPVAAVGDDEARQKELQIFGMPVVNECETNNGGCAHVCTDALVGFTCSCTNGYTLGSDARSCNEISGMMVVDGDTERCEDRTLSFGVRCCAASACVGFACTNGEPAVGMDGTCFCKCQTGWGGELCDQCSSTYYGENCDIPCDNGAECNGGDASVRVLLDMVEDLQDAASVNQQQLSTLTYQSAALARNSIMAQTSSEQRVRAEGGSGLTHVRQVVPHGEQPMTYGEDVGFGFMNMHDHANNRETIGMAEIAAVLNGVEFWTRHNDYALRMPSTTREYHATDLVPFPDVPPAVLAKGTVDEQIVEMREWFKAFKDQDHSVRDYRPYFRPVLAYLEGAWVLDTDTLERPFDSDRHEIEAATWSELHTKSRFLLNSGNKNVLENMPYLPSAVRDVDGTTPVFANWEYRINCHPIQGDIPLDRFHLADDVLAQFQRSNFPISRDELLSSRKAHFTLNPRNQTETTPNSKFNYHLLDQIMEQVPGKDNYGANLVDDALGIQVNHFEHADQSLNVAYYSRVYREAALDAVGRSARRRGFHDANLFAAMTTQDKISGLTNEEGVEQKWTYAIPLEIIYLTPLSKWNPYDIEYKEGSAADEVDANMRDGSEESPYAGSARRFFYRTPSAFYNGGTADSDPADTAKNSVWVENRSGEKVQVAASGHFTIMPEIEGVGHVRQRWPIAPIHHHTNPVYKELKATMHIDALLQQNDGICFHLTLGSSDHAHEVCLTGSEVKRAIENGEEVEKDSSVDEGHLHTVTMSHTELGGWTALTISGHPGHGFQPI